PMRPCDAMQELADNAAVRDDHHSLVRMRRNDALKAAPRALVEFLQRLRAGNDIPALFGEDLLEKGIARNRALAELAAFPLAEEHLAEVGLDTRCEPKAGGERRCGFLRTRQRGDIDGVDLLVFQTLAEQHGLIDAHRVELRIAVTVDERKRALGVRG